MAVAAAPAGAKARETVRAKRERDQELLVWPDLVFVEFICAVLFTITFVILSIFVNAPLLNRANANITPNPSKAPWYFMNLQELLLHMDPGLAGVIIPTLALVFLAVIPYVDRSNDGQGGWFATPHALAITGISAVFTSFYATLCILWDDGAHVRIWQQAPVTFGFKNEGEEPRWLSEMQPFKDWPVEGVLNPIWDFIFARNRNALRQEWEWSLPVPWQARGGDGTLDWPQDFERVPLPLNGTWIWHWEDPGWMPGWLRRIYPYDGHLDIPSILVEYVMPSVAILAGIAILLLLLRKVGMLNSVRDGLIALFTGFMMVYIALTIIGVAFRGAGQQLVPPWRVPDLHDDPSIMREYVPPGVSPGADTPGTGTHA
ncbi:MAG TPA: hypothetical protein VNM91_09665 [Dehalococcoidia bacterium]|nr:hypothetical protein [Dehalococcoidia bacterium]